jgi:hypothetical protein
MTIIVAELSGGLGNQLFQYAAACGIAHRTGAYPAIDTSKFIGAAGSRKFALDSYDLGVPILSGNAIARDFRSVTIPAQAGLERIGCSSDLMLPVHRENNYEFEPATALLCESNYLVGFWQSPQYFSKISDVLRARIAAVTDAGNDAGHARMSGDRSVAVHVRRGDYLVDRGLDSFGLCELDYYRAAVERLRDEVTDARFFIFSDDPDWCREHFTGSDMTVVSRPGSDASNDLAMMARCDHHVIGNSSFGWWGGWLGDRAGSIVIAPIPWYTQAPHATDLIPDHWVRLNRRTGVAWSREQPAIGGERVSAVILSRGREDLLSRAIASVRAQNHVGVEIIVGLCDATPQSIVAIKQRLRDHGVFRLKIAAGAGAALNGAIALASGAWIAFLDERDVWYPPKLRIQIETAHLTGATVVCCRTVPVTGAGGTPTIFPPPGPPEYPLQQALQAGECICGISHIVARTDIFRGRALFDGSFDPDGYNHLWTRLLLENRAAMLWGRHVESATPFVRQQHKQK